MYQKNIQIIFVLLAAFIITGCVTNRPNIANDQSVYTQSSKRIGVAQTITPVPYTHKAGAQGLLDIAINNAVAGGLSEHLQTVNLDNLNELDEKFFAHIQKKHVY